MPHVIWKLAPYIWILCCTFGKWKVCSSIKFTDFMPTCGKKCWQESLWVLATDLALHHRLSHYIYCACCKRKMSAWTLLYKLTQNPYKRKSWHSAAIFVATYLSCLSLTVSVLLFYSYSTLQTNFQIPSGLLPQDLCFGEIWQVSGHS